MRHSPNAANSQMNLLDRYDQALLEALQEDGTLSTAALSERIGLSTTPCWKRVKRLDRFGQFSVATARLAIADAERRVRAHAIERQMEPLKRKLEEDDIPREALQELLRLQALARSLHRTS